MVHLLFLAIGGIIVGLIGGMLGIGGGALLVPLFTYMFKIPIQQAIGTSLVVIIPTALCSSMVHFSHGNVLPKVALSILAFTILGGIIGAHLVPHIPAAVLKKIFALFLSLIAVKMFFYG